MLHHSWEQEGPKELSGSDQNWQNFYLQGYS